MLLHPNRFIPIGTILLFPKTEIEGPGVRQKMRSLIQASQVKIFRLAQGPRKQLSLALVT